MRHIIHKAFCSWEKEEAWLNKMSVKGLSLVDYSWFRYVFEETKPCEYIYRIELINRPVAQDIDHEEFARVNGIEFVSVYGRFVYFRKKATDTFFFRRASIPFVIDRTGKARLFWLAAAVFALCFGSVNIVAGSISPCSPIHVVLGILVLVLAAQLTVMGVQITRKIRRLKRELLIRES